MDNSLRSDDRPHDEAEALLPWYATGQLDADDRAVVEAHLAACSGCRQQLTLERQFVREFRASTPRLDASWARMRARLEGRPARAPLAAIAADFCSMLRRPGVAALALAQVAFLVFGAGLMLSLSRPGYRALASAPVPAAANMIVMFRADATESQMRAALNASGASLVGGPTSADAYLLSVPGAVRNDAVTRLQASPVVAMAQPIDGPAQ